ncbi:farnesyl pyrophosphate synthase [Angomonas deanei]|nr:farnesyl pyrophosphate synthase [Angomonas deanei]EPY38487.1 farnesyl pyrophosphate synthase [Angomonas deanei]|eukprot:EPY37727.1 farnesyl pyrophosphate synthase [Angomonas deanei]
MEKKYAVDANRRRYLCQMMDSTCIGGKYNRGLCVVDVAEQMAKTRQLSPEEVDRVLHDACICGWMIEMLQAHFLVEDDIMDNSKTRRGAPCWYLHPGVTAQVAINDGLILLAWATRAATLFFADRPFFHEVLRVFHEVDMITTIGQLYDVTMMVDSAKLDATVQKANTTDFVEYTTFNYQRIVHHKTSYYTYWLPLTMGLLVSETAHLVNEDKVREVAILMGEYFQVQDDVMDAFTPPEKLGKIGMDIEDAKCSWLAVTFLETATPEQVAKFKANYGQDDKEKVALIKDLYREAKLPEKFEEYEKQVVAKVSADIEELSKMSPEFAASVQTLWEKTYKREK